MVQTFLYALITPLAVMFIIMYSCAFFFVLYKREKRRENDYRKRQYTYDCCANQELKLADKFFMFGGSYEKKFNSPNFFNALSIYNKIAAGVNSDILDENVVKSYFEEDFMQVYNLYRFEMVALRNSNENPYLFNEFEILMERWKRNEFKDRRKDR